MFCLALSTNKVSLTNNSISFVNKEKLLIRDKQRWNARKKDNNEHCFTSKKRNELLEAKQTNCKHSLCNVIIMM